MGGAAHAHRLALVLRLAPPAPEREAGLPVVRGGTALGRSEERVGGLLGAQTGAAGGGGTRDDLLGVGPSG